MQATVTETLLAGTAEAYVRSLRAGNKAPATVEGYAGALAQFVRFLTTHGMPVSVEHVRREHVESFIIDQLSRHAPATAHNRFRALRTFFNWCVDHEEIALSPMRRMKPPKLPEVPPPSVPTEALERLLAACTGRYGTRDRAIITLFAETGLRREEMASLQIEDVDLREQLVTVMGKGRKQRVVPFGLASCDLLKAIIGDRISGPLWRGKHGPLTGTGIAQMVKRRCREAGLPHINPHRFRHTFARDMLRAGLQEGELMALTGWSARVMVDRYTKATAAERAIEAYRRLQG